MKSCRSIFWKRIYMSLGLVLGFYCLDSYSQTNTMERNNNISDVKPSGKFQPPYPFTANELWEKLLQIIAIPSGEITGSKVENILGVQLAKQFVNPKVKPALVLHQGQNWYFDFYLAHDEKGSITAMGFRWNSDLLSQPPAGMCIDEDQIRKDMEALGWSFMGSGYTPPPIDVRGVQYILWKDVHGKTSIEPNADINSRLEYNKNIGRKILFAIDPDKNSPCLRSFALTNDDQFYLEPKK